MHFLSFSHQCNSRHVLLEATLNPGHLSVACVSQHAKKKKKKSSRFSLLISLKVGRSCWFLNCPAPFFLPIPWRIRLLAAGRWLIVPVYLVITIEALPSFIVITHCQLVLLWDPNFMQFSFVRIVNAMRYERVFWFARGKCACERIYIEDLSSCYFTEIVIALPVCVPMDAINAVGWNTGSYKIHMSMD